MIVYQLDVNGYYVGEATADESPLEPGVYLIPAGCVESPPPPPIPDGKRARWNDEGWVVEDIPADNEPDETSTPEQIDRTHILTRFQFISLLTPSEWAAAVGSNVAEVMYFVELVRAAEEVDLKASSTINGLSVAVACGILTEARKTEILEYRNVG